MGRITQAVIRRTFMLTVGLRRQQRSQSDVDKDAVTLLICDVTPIITFRVGGKR